MMRTLMVPALLAIVLVAPPANGQEVTETPAVPDSIVEAIKAAATEDWPDDYAMQRHVLEAESAAYVWVAGYEPPEDVPADVAARIRSKAVEEWPGEYTMQQHVIEEQIEAYLDLQ